MPVFGSPGKVQVEPPPDSVIPQASQISQLKQIFKKSRTSPAIGAEPVAINRTRPPSIALILLKIRTSQKTWLNPFPYFRLASLAFMPASTSIFAKPDEFLNFCFIPLQILLNSFGTDGNAVGWRIQQSSTSFCVFPPKKPTFIPNVALIAKTICSNTCDAGR